MCSSPPTSPKSKLGKSPWNITTQKIFTDLPFSWHFILAFYSDDPIPQKTTLNKPNVLEHSTVLQNYQCWYAFLIFFFTFSPVYKSHHGFQSLNYQTIFTVQQFPECSKGFSAPGKKTCNFAILLCKFCNFLFWKS